MVISHNLSAMNAQRQFNITTNSKAKSSEKISSGYRINRAADDAAGLAISEKMRRQIRGLNQGALNTQDGISLLQVADGALNEVHDMLHRMSELSVKSANGTNTDSDRDAIQQEIKQLKTEVDRIADTTEFNNRKLFKNEGNSSSSGKIIGYRTETVTKTVSIPKTDAFNFSISGVSTDANAATYTVNSVGNQNGLKIGSDLISWGSVKDSDGNSISLNGTLSSGTYSFGYKGMTISFDISRDITPSEFKAGLNGLKFSTREELGESISYTFSAVAGPFYDTIPQIYNYKAANDGIYVSKDSAFSREELYPWPTGMANDLSDVQQNSRYELTCGEVTFAIKTGSNNNASWNNIIENIGEGFFTTNYTVGPYYLSRSVHVGIDDDVSRISYAKVQDILNNGGVRLKADLDGMWIQMGSEVLNKKTWAEMGIDYVEGTEKKEYTYSDQGISFTFVPIIGKTKVDLYLGLNDFALNFTYSDPQIDSNGELTYKYGLEPSDIDIMYPGGAYNKYVGPLMKVDQTESTILADSITNTPQYTYYEIEIIEEEIEVPIYEEGQEENGVQSLWIQSGADVEDGMFLVLENMNTSILGIDETDVSTDDGARNAISSIKNAIGKVSAIRSNLGAQQNRLEHTYKNVTNTAENTQASESIIRDTDMAKEMVQLSLKNILEQAGVSMMAQANQTNQGVLSLLQ